MTPLQFGSLLFIAAITSLAGCDTPDKKPLRPDVLVSAMDTTVSPGDDFFRYAHGTWIKNNPIPAAENRWGINVEVQNEVYSRLVTICKDAAANPGDKKSTQMVGALWATGMDSLAIEQQGASGLKPYLDKIAAIKSKRDLPKVISGLRPLGVRMAFGIYVGQDDKNSEQYALFIYQGGLGLPDRDYYFNKDSRTANVRTAYVAHIAKMLTLLGRDSAEARKSSEHIMKFETSLAGSSRKLEDLRDPYKNYNKFSVADVKKKYSDLGWDSMLSGLPVDSVIVGQPEFLRETNRMVSSETIDTWKDYLTWQLVRRYAFALSHDFVQENFNFYGTTLQGRKELKPRWKRILDVEERYIGDLLGQEFVRNYFPEKTKMRYVNLVNEMIATYREHIEALTWMSDSTKQEALLKLSTIRKKIGYPDKWKDYSALSFSRDQFLANCIAGEQWLYQYDMQKLGKPVDRDEWGMTPQTWNAYYNPSNNEIVLPAAIFMIPGINDEDADDAIVYGYAGASTIGHELTHGFDDQGSQYDENGNLKNWWSKEDRERFDKMVQGIVGQFDGYKVLDSMHINGSATAGENIADLGGVMIGLDAFKKTEQYKKGETIGGLTPLQRYFLGYALSWRIIARDEMLSMQVMSDVHSPPFLRVNGPFSNVPEFYEAFKVQPNQAMWRADSLRVKIW
jgi:putative endopeptidase